MTVSKKRPFVQYGAIIVLLATPAAALLWLVPSLRSTNTRPESLNYFEMPAECPQTDYFEAAWWLYSQRAFPLARIPAHAYRRELDRIQRASRNEPSPLGLAQSLPRWISLGPRPIYGPSQHAQNGAYSGLSKGLSPASGRIADVAIDPGDAGHWLIGAALGGIWETRDGGVTFEPRSDGFWLATGAIAFAPSDPRIVYAGLGESVGVGFGGNGVLKSRDGGATWSLLPNTEELFNQVAFSEIKVDPLDADVVLAAVTFSRLGYRGAAPSKAGVWKSNDGGGHWEHVLEGMEASDLETSPDNLSEVYAALGSRGAGVHAGVYRSVDAGDHWERLDGPWNREPGGVGRIEMAIAPSRPATLYVSVSDAADGEGLDNQLLGLWRTDDARSLAPTWIAIPFFDATAGYCEDQCWYDHEIIVDPEDADTLYAGGVPLWKCTACSNQPQWERVSKTSAEIEAGIHVDQHAMAWVGHRLVVGNDGGLVSTEDGGRSWVNHNSTLSITQFYRGSIDPADPDLVLAGAQDNSSSIFTGAVWDNLPGGDGAGNFISRQNPDRRWAYSSQGLSLLRVRDGRRDGGGAEVIESGTPNAVPFIASFDGCPANEDVLIFGARHLWKTEDFFSAERPTWGANTEDLGKKVSAVAFAPSDASCRTYAFSTNYSDVWATRDGGATWNITPGFDPNQPGRIGALPFRFITDLAFDPRDPDTLYVTFSGFDDDSNLPGHLYRTNDAGSDQPIWRDVTPPGSNLPFNAVAIDPQNPDVIYVGADLGVWRSLDGGVTWLHMGPETGMPNVPVFDLEIGLGGRVVAFTFGRGAFVLPPADGSFLPERLFFAHFGKGEAGALRLSSQLTVLNPDPVRTVNATVSIQGDDGTGLEVPLDDGVQTRGTHAATDGVDLAVPPRGLRTLTAASGGAVVSGSVQVSSDGRLAGVIQFGGSIGLAGVGGDQGQPSGFLAPIERDVARGVNTGVAIRNLGVGPVDLMCLLVSKNGSIPAHAVINALPRGGHLALFVDEFPWNVPIDLSGFAGILGVFPTQGGIVPPVSRLAATVLQVRDDELATLPVAPIFSSTTPAGGRELFFAHFGKGSSGPTQLFSQLTLLNLSTRAAEVELQVRGDDGNPLEVNLNGEAVAGNMHLEIPGPGMRTLATDSGGALQTGSVRVFADKPLAGVVLFGGSVGVAGVGSSQLAPNGFLALMETDASLGVNTGVAIAGVTEAPVELGLELLDADGHVVATSSRRGSQAIPPLGHVALFVDQIDWTPPVDFTRFQGVLDVKTSSPVGATVIQTRPGQFATMPVAVR